MAKAVKQKQAAAELEVLDKTVIGRALGADEDELLVSEAGSAIREFLKGVAGFFTTAKALERTALLQLEAAKGLKLPTSGEEDERLQGFARGVREDKKDVLEHWKITATISGFHRRMTSRRGKAEDALDEASKIANDLHNRYVEQERRRVAEVQDRLRREEEERIRKQREQELLEAEARAVAAEESSQELSEREQTFVALYTGGAYAGNAQHCAQRAGYKDAFKSAARLLSLGKVQKAIQAKRDAAAIREQAAARAQEPIHAVDVPTIKPDVTTKGNRTYWSAELLDEQKLIAAVLSGQHNIPTDILTVKPAMLNHYAKQLEARINMWPGVRAKKDTRI